MFCPQCGSTQPDELRFCKNCGANLSAVKVALKAPDKVERSDWGKTWVAEMLMTRHEKDRTRGITAEGKRRREVKAGIITTASGLSLAVVLAVLMEAIVINGRISELAADILSRVWIVALIPVVVGLSLIFNGTVVSKWRAGSASIPETDLETQRLDPAMVGHLPPANTKDLVPPPQSVTEGTTRHLKVKR